MNSEVNSLISGAVFSADVNIQHLIPQKVMDKSPPDGSIILP
jgi:hypothetical protein